VDGPEVSIEEGSPDNSLRDLPSVRFLSIKSADFVDAPAANEAGLFSKHQTDPIQEGPEMAEEQTKEVTTDEVQEDVQLDEVQEEESLEESMEEKMAKQIEELQAIVEEQSSQIAELQGALDASKAKVEQLACVSEGQEALAEGNEADPAPSIIEQFSQASGGDQTRLWKQNKKEILRAARG